MFNVVKHSLSVVNYLDKFFHTNFCLDFFLIFPTDAVKVCNISS